MMRIVFMGTPDFSVLALQALIKTGLVVGVVTQPDRPAGRGNQLRKPPVKIAAEAADIPVFQPKSLRKFEAAAPIREWKPDLIIVAAFGQILKSHLLDLPPLGCINIHASLLPRWRGAAPIQAAILNGDQQTGITLMRMDEGLDTGDMLVKEIIDIDPRETVQALHDRLAVLGGEMMTRYLDDLIEQRFPRVPQNDELATYAARIQKEDGRIDWNTSAITIDRQIRAFNPWPGTFTQWQGKQFKIKSAGFTVDETASSEISPGRVIRLSNEQIGIVTGDGIVLPEEVQLQGKKPMHIAEFVRGRSELIDSRLGI